ncbi:MAG: hypothetical protein IJM75_03160 [Ruminococcus sp.]|nr:hypothetical protein [Ruminococcus sp.]
MANPNLKKIEELLKSGEEFNLTNSQYKKKTGLDIPKNPSYLINSSAIAKLADRYGRKIVLQERQISFVKK